MKGVILSEAKDLGSLPETENSYNLDHLKALLVPIPTHTDAMSTRRALRPAPNSSRERKPAPALNR